MRRKILIIDDDIAILDVIKIILEDEGYSIETVSDVQLIFKKVNSTLPDLVLLDYWLPGIDGGKVIEMFKSDNATSSIPIVMISADSQSEHKVKQLGADDFLSKPFDIDDLVSMVKKYV